MALQPFRNVVQGIDPNAARDAFQTAQTDRFVDTTRKNVLSEFALNEPVRAAQRTGAMDRAASERFLSGMQPVHAFLKAGNIPAAINAAQQHRGTITSGNTANTDEVIRGLQSGNEADIAEATGFLDQIFGATGKQANVQSAFIGANGNRWLTMRDGTQFDTGVKVSETSRIITRADGSQVVVDVTGSNVGDIDELISSKEGLAAIEAGSRAKERGTQIEQIAAIAPKAEAARQQAAPTAVAEAEAAEIAGRPEAATEALSQIKDIDNIFGEIDVAMENVGFTSTGRTGQVFGLIAPGITKSGVLQGTLSTIKASLGLEAMAKLKRLSSSGSTGMGNQSDREFAALQDHLVALDQNAPPDELRRRLNKVTTSLSKLRRSMLLKIRLQNGEISRDDARSMNQSIYLLPNPTGATATNPETGEQRWEGEDGNWYTQDGEKT